jgi:hypothetical protein
LQVGREKGCLSFRIKTDFGYNMPNS